MQPYGGGAKYILYIQYLVRTQGYQGEPAENETEAPRVGEVKGCQTERDPGVLTPVTQRCGHADQWDIRTLYALGYESGMHHELASSPPTPVQ
jgi:hypothetical protein